MITRSSQQIAIFLTLVVASLGVRVPLAFADPASGGTGQPAPDLSVGKAAYEQHCARCHGLTGKGEGRDAKRLYPRPRDFTTGIYKFRSTESGTPPTDEDLFATITDGLPGSGMPDWGHVDEDVRWQLVYYLKSLLPTVGQIAPQPVSLGQDPGAKRVDLARGREIYEKLGCAACHGASGRANGPSAATLVDDWGFAIRPANLTEGWNYRGGSDPQAIVARMLSGIDGSQMPSYAEAGISAEEAWQLAYYVRSLQQEPQWAMIVRATPLAHEDLPALADEARWQGVERAAVHVRNVVSLTGELAAPQTVTTVLLQAVYTDRLLRVRVSWDDPSEERAEPADALALVFRPQGESTGDVITLQTWPLPDSPPLDLCLWSANRLQASEAVINRFEPLLEGAQAGITLPSEARYEDGRWTVVLTRPLVQSSLEGAAQCERGEFIPVAFVVWDGGNPGSRAVSTWVDLVLPQAPAASPDAKTDRAVIVVWIVSGLVLLIALGLALRTHRV